MASPQRRPALTKAQVKTHPLAPTPPAGTPSAAAEADLTGPAPEKAATVVGERRRPGGPAAAALEGPTATLSARVPEELRDAVKLYAVTHRESVQHIVTEAVRRYIHE